MKNDKTTITESKFKTKQPKLKDYELENTDFDELRTEYTDYLKEKQSKEKEPFWYKACMLLLGIVCMFVQTMCGASLLLVVINVFDFLLGEYEKNPDPPYPKFIASCGLLLICFVAYKIIEFLGNLIEKAYIKTKEKEPFNRIDEYNNMLKYEKDLERYNNYLESQKREYWLDMDGFTFEKEVANLFKQHGFSAQLTKGGPDGGIDIVLRKNGKRIAVQCKAHKNKISESIARDLYGVINAYGYNAGFLVTLSGASSNTYSFCNSRGITVFDVNDLIKIQDNTYKWSKISILNSY